jgi:NADPH-dependent curcumin reductase CurA
MPRSREIHLKSRPDGLPTPDNFSLVEVDTPALQNGQALIRTLYFSVDPYMRGLMRETAPYDFMPPWDLGQPLTGASLGQVVESKIPDIEAGQYVIGALGGWREYFVAPAGLLQPVDPALVPLPAYLGPLGGTGLTAYTGLLNIGKPQVGETLFVSSAAGAVGSIACQIGKIKGCRVIGSAGSDEKVAWLKNDLHLDGVINYKDTPDLDEALRQHCPDGIDIYFDNVGGAHLEAALNQMNDFGRIVVCGMISTYNNTDPAPGPSNLSQLILKRITMQGMLVVDYLDQRPQFDRDMAEWMGSGKIQWKETIIEGIENAPTAFMGLFKGDNLGKMLVKVGA